MKKLFFLLLFPVALLAQKTQPGAPFYDAPGGKQLFTAKDSIPVYTTPHEKSGYYNTSSLWLVEGTGDRDVLEPGTVLYNLKGAESGVVDAEITVADAGTAPGKYRKSHTLVRLEGVVFGNRLKEGSIPEEIIPGLFAQKGLAQRNTVERLKNEWTFVETSDYEACLAMDAGNHITGPDHLKMGLVFKVGQSLPFAVVSREIPLAIPKVKETRQEGELYFYYLQKPNAGTHEAVYDIILNYLPL